MKLNPFPRGNPLVSFYVIAYNQENYVREAVLGALRQTYEPLQVVLSDDCSTDTTFGIMQDLARGYRGPHEVVVRRNDKNLGVGGHINAVLGACEGEIIVASAGDDWSVSDRVERLMVWWRDNAPEAALVYSNILEIDEWGKVILERDFRLANAMAHTDEKGVVRWALREHVNGRALPLHGASFAYRREVFELCGPLWQGVVFEDNVLNVRAEILGGVALCPEFLVNHRTHAGQVTSVYSGDVRRNIARRKILAWSNIQTFAQNMSDIDFFFAQGLVDSTIHRQARELWTARLGQAKAEYAAGFGTWPARVIPLLKYLTLGRAFKTERNVVLRALAPDWLYVGTHRVLSAILAVRSRRSRAQKRDV